MWSRSLPVYAVLVAQALVRTTALPLPHNPSQPLPARSYFSSSGNDLQNLSSRDVPQGLFETLELHARGRAAQEKTAAPNTNTDQEAKIWTKDELEVAEFLDSNARNRLATQADEKKTVPGQGASSQVPLDMENTVRQGGKPGVQQKRNTPSAQASSSRKRPRLEGGGTLGPATDRASRTEAEKNRLKQMIGKFSSGRVKGDDSDAKTNQ